MTSDHMLLQCFTIFWLNVCDGEWQSVHHSLSHPNLTIVFLSFALTGALRVCRLIATTHDDCHCPLSIPFCFPGALLLCCMPSLAIFWALVNRNRGEAGINAVNPNIT